MSSEISKSQGLSITALVLGIVSIVLALAWFIAIIAGVLAIIFGAGSLKSAGRKKSIAGIITGVIGIVSSILVILGFQAALSSLQGSQRDNVRKSDVSKLVVDITNYQANNQGQLPAAADLTTDDLLHAESVNDSGQPTTTSALYVAGSNCEDETSARNYSVTILLESGVVYCQGS